MVDRFLNSAAGAALIPAARAFVRFTPPSTTKDHLWHRVIDPYLAWRNHRFVAQTIAGSFGGNTKDILQQYLYYFGIWEPAVTRFVRRRLKSGDGFVDVGANVGYFSLLAAQRVGYRGRVTAVEASPEVFTELQRNLRRNTVGIRAVPLAASDKAGTIRIYHGSEGNCGSSTTVEGLSGYRESTEVAAAPLSDALSQIEIASARIIKIDVEGAEAAVLSGIEAAMNDIRSDCEFLVEIHPQMLAQAGRSAQEVFDWFADRDFHPYLIENDYDASAYLWPAPTPLPQRIWHCPEWDANVVFSRIVATEL